MIDILALVGLLFVMSLCAAGTTDLYSFALGDPHRAGEPAAGRILSWLGAWIDQRMADHKAVTEQIRASRMRLATDEKQLKKARRFARSNPYKLLGGCPKCLNVWVALATFIVFHYLCATKGYGFSWWWLVPFNGMGWITYNLVAKLRG